MYARHQALTASTVATISSVPAFGGGVWIKPSGADVYGTIDGTAPTVAGDNTFFCADGAGLLVPVGADTDGVIEVKLISSGTPTVHVEVY